MAGAYTFSESGAKRIVKAVRWAEGAQNDLGGQRRRFVGSYTPGVKILVHVSSATQFAPNRYQYSATSVGAWNETEHGYDIDGKGTEYPLIYNLRERKNTANMLRGNVSLPPTQIMLPIAVGEEIEIWSNGAKEGGVPVYLCDVNNDNGCSA